MILLCNLTRYTFNRLQTVGAQYHFRFATTIWFVPKLPPWDEGGGTYNLIYIFMTKRIKTSITKAVAEVDN